MKIFDNFKTMIHQKEIEGIGHRNFLELCIFGCNQPYEYQHITI